MSVSLGAGYGWIWYVDFVFWLRRGNADQLRIETLFLPFEVIEVAIH